MWLIVVRLIEKNVGSRRIFFFFWFLPYMEYFWSSHVKVELLSKKKNIQVELTDGVWLPRKKKHLKSDFENLHNFTFPLYLPN